ncbi:hypothetical protein [Arthrobacter sp. A2-55]|uniref:hypothetical protein n=1 Tax=Arthrobacter sp. A2-55 TaxID=2897337 RepID=UPI0021CD1FAC|nr:hypothetical protein [Arthrobacter sp. A2-55]MCU6479010.1 hypothetical protein [Arthrobacter sp. A2-55]
MRAFVSVAAANAREAARHTSGKFGEQVHAAPSIELHRYAADLRVDADFVANCLADGPGHQTADPLILEAIASRLNASRNFSDANIREVTDEVWRESYGYTPEESADYQLALDTLNSLGETSAAKSVQSYVAGLESHAGLGDFPDVEALRQVATQLEELETCGASPEDIHDLRQQLSPLLSRSGASSTRPGLSKPERVDPDGRTLPVPVDDPRVQGGQVFDKIVDRDGTEFFRRREHVWPDEPYAMRLQANRPLSAQESEHLAQLMGYAYAAEVRGERMGTPQMDTPYSFIVPADTTKSRSDDVGAALSRFETGLPQLFKAGSPQRTTNRSGPVGSRLVEPFGDLTFELFYDSVSDESW